MTEDEMVRALMRDHGFDRGQATRIARDALLRESVGTAYGVSGSPPITMKRITYAGGRLTIRDDPEPSESDIQIELLKLLVGEALPGQPRPLDGGLAAKYPELALVYAINPNAGAVSKRGAGRAKAMGLLSNMPDLHLPIMRGPFLTLYVELKKPGEYGTPGQRAMAAALREEGHCVIECQGVEEGAAAFIGYLALPKNRPSARAVCGRHAPAGTLDERIQAWRDRAHEMLTPARRTRNG